MKDPQAITHGEGESERDVVKTDSGKMVGRINDDFLNASSSRQYMHLPLTLVSADVVAARSILFSCWPRRHLTPRVANICLALQRSGIHATS